MRLALMAILLGVSLCSGQEQGDFKPATSNVLDAQYPKVDMEIQADGFWTFTTPPMAPGLHYYTLIVDGAEVSDPGSTAYFGGSKWAGAIEVPEAGVDYYLPKDVPHGQVRGIRYRSSVTGTWWHALVYLPPDYDTETKTRYPVLYLQHVGGDCRGTNHSRCDGRGDLPQERGPYRVTFR